MSLGDDYIAAVKSGNTALADYLAQGLAVQAGINVNSNQVQSAPLSALGLPALPSIDGQNSGNSVADPFSLLNPLTWLNNSLFNNAAQGAYNTGTNIGNAASSTGAALSFITDIPRVATTVLGLILIIAGIFALSKGPVVNIAASALKTAATT